MEDKENSQIRNTLLQVLYLCGNDNFKKAIIDSSTKIEELEMFYEAAGFVGVYEKELSKMNELQIEKLYKETFSHE